MNIDATIVSKYLNDDKFDEIENHWVFDNIEKEEHLFESPNIEYRQDIKKSLVFILNTLSNFSPLNRSLFSAIYPQWQQIIEEMNVLLVVGCPNPYDAMVKEHNGNQYVIFDIIRLNAYVELGHNIEFMIKQLVTHEISHICLHKKYPVPISNSYYENLKYIVFDEAFAHILAINENIENYNFEIMIEEHYFKSLYELSAALQETDSDKQSKLLIQANSGHYWDKFGSISGKLFLARNIGDLINIYAKGIDNFIWLMGLKF